MSMNYKISYKQAQQIIDIACKDWKTKLVNNWSQQIVLKKDVEISKDFYKTMRQACTSEQNKLFDNIFGKDKSDFFTTYKDQIKCFDHIYKTDIEVPEFLEGYLGALQKIIFMRDLVVDGWQPVGKEIRYCPWFYLDNFRFGYSSCDLSPSTVSARMCYKTKEQSDWVASVMFAEYKKFYTFE